MFPYLSNSLLPAHPRKNQPFRPKQKTLKNVSNSLLLVCPMKNQPFRPENKTLKYQYLSNSPPRALQEKPILPAEKQMIFKYLSNSLLLGYPRKNQPLRPKTKYLDTYLTLSSSRTQGKTNTFGRKNVIFIYLLNAAPSAPR